MGEKRFLNHLEELKELIYFLVITLFAIIARISAKDYISVDANIFLLPWYDEIKAGGGIIALKNQIGDYEFGNMGAVRRYVYIFCNSCLVPSV